MSLTQTKTHRSGGIHKRPSPNTITGRLWLAYDKILAANTGKVPKRAEAIKQAAASVPEAAIATRKTQFQRWRISLGNVDCLHSNSTRMHSIVTENNEIEGMGSLEDFDPHKDDERPNAPGIYVFYDISNRPIYVGEGESVRKRIRNHNEKFWFKPPIVETASWIKIPNDKLRRQIETLLIKFLKDNAVINKQNVERD
jgi:hypothetical protein